MNFPPTMQEHAPFRHQKTSSTEPWQQELVSHAPEYGAEFVGTTFLMFCVVGAVGVMFAQGSPAVAAIPSVQVRLFLTGLVLGGAGSLVAITPLGRLSGAHLNPAISLGFFTLGRMQIQDLLGYVVAQMAGASLGAWTGQLAFGGLASGVRDALNQPGKLVGPQAATAAEAVATFALAAVVFSMVSRCSLARWTPLVVVGVVAIIVWLDGFAQLLRLPCSPVSFSLAPSPLIFLPPDGNRSSHQSRHEIANETLHALHFGITPARSLLVFCPHGSS